MSCITKGEVQALNQSTPNVILQGNDKNDFDCDSNDNTSAKSVFDDSFSAGDDLDNTVIHPGNSTPATTFIKQSGYAEFSPVDSPVSGTGSSQTLSFKREKTFKHK